jgi:hypothetical protein
MGQALLSNDTECGAFRRIIALLLCALALEACCACDKPSRTIALVSRFDGDYVGTPVLLSGLTPPCPQYMNDGYTSDGIPIGLPVRAIKVEYGVAHVIYDSSHVLESQVTEDGKLKMGNHPVGLFTFVIEMSGNFSDEGFIGELATRTYRFPSFSDYVCEYEWRLFKAPR